MQFGGIEVARILGIRLRLDWSWFVVLLLLTWTFATFDFPLRAPGLGVSAYWLLGFSAALLLFVSVLIHELAHAVTARGRGIPVERITLFIFGGVAEMRMEARRPSDEFVLTIVGPLASLALAGAFWGLGRGAAAAGADTLAMLSDTLGYLNLILAVFNMVPAFPLDGGRVLRSILWRLTGSFSRATRWAAGVGRLFGWLLVGWGAWLFIGPGARLAGAWAVFLGWFLARAATGAVDRVRLRDIHTSLAAYPVSAALAPRNVPVAESSTIDELIRDSLLAHAGDARLVARNGTPVGAILLDEAAAVSEGRRLEVRVLEIMHRLDELLRFEPDLNLAEAAEALQESRARAALVGTADGIVGVLTMSDLERWVERLEALDG
ncbi:MAG TPA: site-2 protease family protein [Gemmatimonadota bacterium]|nr:site-2 protease family protein [Gemmatimonadota bacterium]